MWENSESLFILPKIADRSKIKPKLNKNYFSKYGASGEIGAITPDL
jgi:hypothetical protein